MQKLLFFYKNCNLWIDCFLSYLLRNFIPSLYCIDMLLLKYSYQTWIHRIRKHKSQCSVLTEHHMVCPRALCTRTPFFYAYVRLWCPCILSQALSCNRTSDIKWGGGVGLVFKFPSRWPWKVNSQMLPAIFKLITNKSDSVKVCPKSEPFVLLLAFSCQCTFLC